MSPRRHRGRVVGLAVLAAAPLVAGCSSVQEGPAAAVGGAEISADDLIDELEVLRDDEVARASVYPSGVAVAGDGQGTFATNVVADRLNERVYLELFRQEVEERGVEVTDEVRDAARQQVGDLPGLPEELAADRIDGFAAFLALQQDELDERGLDDPQAFATTFLASQVDTLEVACLSHILIGVDERSADEARARAEELAVQLEAGADFATLATEASEDPGSAAQGGDLGCFPPGRYVPEFDAAAFALLEGELSSPVDTQFGTHLILLRERRAADIGDEIVQEQVGAELDALRGEAIEELLTEVTTAGDVEVDPRFGSWRQADGQGRFEVIPPEGPRLQGELDGDLDGGLDVAPEPAPR